MKILDSYADFLKIICEILCHTLGKCSYKYLILFLNFLINLTYKIIYLTLYWSNCYLWIKKSCRPYNLLCPHKFMFFLIPARRSRYKKHL